MNIFSIFNMAQAANPKAEATIHSGGHDAIIITWLWDGQYLNRRYCKARMTGHRFGEYEAWRMHSMRLHRLWASWSVRNDYLVTI